MPLIFRTDVLAEHAAAMPLTPSDLASFAAECIPRPALTWSAHAELSILARDRVHFDGAGKFEFDRYQRGGGEFAPPFGIHPASARRLR